MTKDILVDIKERLPTFSKGQKRIGNYILSSYSRAAYMTAHKLGQQVNVSESTVVRFATELFSCRQVSQQKRSFPDPLQPLDLQPRYGAHPPYLPVFSLVYHHRKKPTASLLSYDSDLRRCQTSRGVM